MVLAMAERSLVEEGIVSARCLLESIPQADCNGYNRTGLYGEHLLREVQRSASSGPC
jgi:hypothetical protein